MIRKYLLALSLLYLSLYFSFSLIVYTPLWYELYSFYNKRIKYIGKRSYDEGVKEIRLYFLYRGNLISKKWTTKEKVHLKEVRNIYNKLLIILIFAIGLLYFCYEKKHIKNIALVNIAIISLFTLIIPFFKIFWKKGFHLLLFDNLLWKNTKEDFSYYLFPNDFFKYAIIIIIILSIIINVLLCLYFTSLKK